MFLHINPLYYFFKSLLIYFERERERGHKKDMGRAERGERIPSRLHTVNAELEAGLELMNHEIMS